MSKKLIFMLGLILILAVIFNVYGVPALAAISDQEDDPQHRHKPNQESYLQPQEVPLLPLPGSSKPDSIALLLPVDQWSRMTFDSYIYSEDRWDIFAANGNFTNLVRLTSDDPIDIFPRLNRGCTRIAFASDRENLSYDIYTIRTDGSDLVRLTKNGTDDVKPAWSPDGTRIAFQAYRDGNAEVYLMNSDGTGQTNLTHSGDYDGEPTWSPDGTHIAFISRRTGSYRVYVMNADGSNPVMLSQQRYSEDPVWSPDGSRIVYDADDDLDGWYELWVMNSDGSGQTLLTDMGNNYFDTYANGWSPDNAWITYTAVHWINYYGEWYWDYTYLVKLDPVTGYYQVLNPGRETDWDLDWTTTDVQPPTTAMSVPPSPVIYQFTVTWWGQDNSAGIKYYDVQVRDGAGGAWTDWQMRTSESSATFTGIGGHEYFFRTRAVDNAFNLQPWPGSPQASAKVESSPPITSVRPLRPFTRGDQATLTWGGVDPGGSGIQSYDILFMDEDIGSWDTVLSGTVLTTTIFTGEPGHTYHFSSRGTDRALNMEAQHFGDGETSTAFYTWLTSGTAYDHTGVPVSGMDISVAPPAFITHPSDIDGRYSAFLADNPEIKTINWMKEGYGSLPATDFGSVDACMDVFLPPVDNIVQDFGFESGTLPGVWQVDGVYTPTLTNTVYHSGSNAGVLGISSSLSAPIVLDPQYGSSSSMTSDKWGNVHIVRIDYDHPNYLLYYDKQLPDGTWLPTEYAASFTTAGFWGLGIVADGNGNVHVLLMAFPDVIYVMRDTDGNWSNPLVIFSTPSAVWINGLEVDDSSTIHAVIQGFDSIYYAHLADNESWQVELVPNVVNLSEAAYAFGTHGELNLAWTSSSAEVYFTLRRTDGTWTNPKVFSRPGYSGFIDIVVNSANLPYIIWTAAEPRAIYYTMMTSTGIWLEPRDISLGNGGFGVALLIDQYDRIYGIWTENWVSEEIVFAYLDANGDWSPPENISNTYAPSAYTAATISAKGDLYVVWWDFDNGYKIYYTSRLAGVWGSPVRLSNESSQNTVAQVIVDVMDGVHIAWIDGVDNHLYYIQTQTNVQTGDSWLSQSLTVPISMTNPTLSFLTSLSGVSDVSGNELQVQVTSGITTTLYTTTTPTAWEHSWFDMSPWSGEQITLTFQLSENAGFPPASAILDEVTLGAAHPDAWVDLSGSPMSALPGQQLTLQMEYGNRGAVLAASSLITVTLPGGVSFVDASVPPTIIGDLLVWQVGDLPGNGDPNSITLTVQVDTDAVLGRVVSFLAEIETSSSELELMNNTSQATTYLGHVGLLPVIRR